MNSWVMNHSKKPLLPEERSLLEKGPKFAPTPTNIPLKNIVDKIEAAIHHLPDAMIPKIQLEHALLPFFIGHDYRHTIIFPKRKAEESL